VIFFLSFPQQQTIAQETLQPGVFGAESSRKTGASTNAPPSETQEKCGHQLVHCDIVIVATVHMTHDAHLKTVPKYGSSKNTK